MIKVTRVNNEAFLINSDLIEYVEETSLHTVVYMMSGRKLVIAESPEMVRELVLEYKRQMLAKDPVGHLAYVHLDDADDGELQELDEGSTEE
ncbi:flagellar FlbD family protein [Clostridia bacterium OttesenSCG-928-F22]|nr:flagellar FlbD family protein [Clostridia bacterium OttesenSCG-928-F22]